ncbi:major facilitator superfamily MFS_1 [Actinobacteria bacterium OV450]|nr:major facilitator superfamily MFS_1 [Actinobacteria bacterium OV450]
MSGPRQRIALLVSVGGAMLVALDGTVLSVAQPRLTHDLGASVAQVQWTSTAYLLAVAAFLVLAGRMGDRYGHARLLLVGALGFAAASAGIALAPGVGWVIGLRAVQGVFGALLQPATLALLRLAYPADRLATPVAVRTGAIAVAAAAGPLLGGVLVAESGWRSVFWLNVPVALVIGALALAVRVPAPPRTGAERAPAPAGAALLVAALAVLVHALAGVPAHGWTAPPTLLGLGGAGALAVVLVRCERRAAQPLVPAAVARSRPVTASIALLAAVSAGMFGALFTATFLLQDVRGLDPLATGLLVLPLTGCMVAGAPAAGVALRRYGPRRTALTGAGLVVLGIGALGAWWSGPGVMAAFALLGAGFAAVMVTATASVVGDAPAGYAGVVGGLKQTAMNVGPTLGIAVAAGGAAGAGASPAALFALAGLAAVGLVPASLLPSGARRAAAGDVVGEDPGERGQGRPAPDGPADGERRQVRDRDEAQRAV